MGALENGVPLASFWRLTPRALSWHHKAAARRAEEEMTRLYAAESLSRVKKLPGLNKWLGKRQPAAKATVYAGGPRDFFRQFTVGYRGGEVKKVAANG